MVVMMVVMISSPIRCSRNATNDISTNNTKSNNDVYFFCIGGGLLIIAIGFLVYYKFDKLNRNLLEINKKSQPEPVYRKMI